MSMNDADRKLIERCLKHEPKAWVSFVDSMLPIVYHVIHHTSHMRSVSMTSDAVDDLAAEFMAMVVVHDFRILRKFAGKARLTTYIAVIARRFVVNHLARTQAIQRRVATRAAEQEFAASIPPDLRIDDEEEIEWLLSRLKGREAELVRGYYLEHKSYADLSTDIGIPEENIGQTLTRLRRKLKRASRKKGQTTDA